MVRGTVVKDCDICCRTKKRFRPKSSSWGLKRSRVDVECVFPAQRWRILVWRLQRWSSLRFPVSHFLAHMLYDGGAPISEESTNTPLIATSKDIFALLPMCWNEHSGLLYMRPFSRKGNVKTWFCQIALPSRHPGHSPPLIVELCLRQTVWQCE